MVRILNIHQIDQPSCFEVIPMKPKIAKCIPSIADKVGKGNDYFHFEATPCELLALSFYAEAVYNQKNGKGTMEFEKSKSTGTGLKQLAQQTLFIGKIYDETVPQLYRRAWVRQLRSNKVSKEEIIALMPNNEKVVNEIFSKHHFDPLPSYILEPELGVVSKSDVVLENENFNDYIFLKCDQSERQEHFPKKYIQSIPYIKKILNESSNYNLILYEEATSKDIQNLNQYIEYHYLVSDKAPAYRIVSLERSLYEALGFESLVKLTIMASALYEKFPEHLTEFWNFWKNDCLKSMSEDDFIQNYFSGRGNRELGKYIYATFVKHNEAIQSPNIIKENQQQKKEQSKNKFLFTTLFKFCMEYKTFISLFAIGALGAGHVSGIFNVFNPLHPLSR